MRTKKRLRWAREEGTRIYKAKRKTETAVIVPQPGGGYAVVYRSHKCKRKMIVSTITEAKEATEAMRVTKPNPLAMSRSTKMVFLGVGLGAAAAGGIFWALNKKMIAAAAVPGATPPATIPPPLLNPPSLQVHVQLSAGANSTSYNGGTVFIDLPIGAQSWTSIDTDTSVAGTSTPIMLDVKNPVGTYTLGYVDGNSQHQTATLTITGPGA